MDVEQVRLYCLSLPHVTEDLPFGPTTLVFRVGNKIFGLLSLDEIDNQRINLKNLPDRCIELREQYHYFTPGFHMNKTHWNTVVLYPDVDARLVIKMIKESYEIVFNSLPKSIKSNLI
jgi:predicted DNA-binding protein (MmcQ/YjbR family)